MTRTLIFDLESNGLLNQMDRIHCLMIKHEESGEMFAFQNSDKINDIADGVAMLSDPSVTCVVGHNIVSFDIPAIQLIYPDFEPAGVIRDTLVMTRLIYANQKDHDYPHFHAGRLAGKYIGSHKLESWGYRLGMMKGDYSQIRYAYAKEQGWDEAKTHDYVWGTFNQDMFDYCIQDVEVTSALWNKLQADERDFSKDSIIFEHRIHSLMAKQERNGFPFNREEAEKLGSSMEETCERLEKEATDHFGSWYCPKKKKELWPAYDNEINSDADMFCKCMFRGTKDAKDQIREFVASLDYDNMPNPNPKRKREARRIYTDWWLNVAFADRRLILEKFKEMGFIGSHAKLELDKFSEPGPNEDHSRRVWAAVEKHKNTRTYKNFCTVGKNGKKRFYFNTTEGAEFCRVVRKDFNPGSRHNIIDRFTTLYNWRPDDFTEKGSPKVDDVILRSMEVPSQTAMDMAVTLAEVFYYRKRIGQIKTGKNAWLEKVDDKGFIHCFTNTGGTISGRCSHSNPNLGQVPAVKVKDIKDEDGNKIGSKILKGREGDHGFECRSLFRVPDTHVQVGCDLSGIEFRCLANLVCRYDNGQMIDTVLNGSSEDGTDVHSVNQMAADLETRDIAKRCLYCLMYGGGDWKLGHTAYPMAPDGDKMRLGREIRDKLMKGLPALAQAIKEVQKEAKEGFLIGLDGRRVYSRSPHSALNLRLQHDAAMIAKKWALTFDDKLYEAGFDHGWDKDYALLAFVHDELQTATRPDIATDVAEMCVEAARETGEFFNFQCPVDAEYKIGKNWAECH